MTTAVWPFPQTAFYRLRLVVAQCLDHLVVGVGECGGYHLAFGRLGKPTRAKGVPFRLHLGTRASIDASADQLVEQKIRCIKGICSSRHG